MSYRVQLSVSSWKVSVAMSVDSFSQVSSRVPHVCTFYQGPLLCPQNPRRNKVVGAILTVKMETRLRRPSHANGLILHFLSFVMNVRSTAEVNTTKKRTLVESLDGGGYGAVWHRVDCKVNLGDGFLVHENTQCCICLGGDLIIVIVGCACL